MKRENAYLTVEAALVMPFVLGVVVLTVYLMFFQYNRCLMEQNAGILAMRGCTLQAEDGKSLAESMRSLSGREEDERYLAWNAEPAAVTLRGNNIFVEQKGSLRFPFRGLDFWGGGSSWETLAQYRNQRIRPVEFIRNCRRLTGGN